MAASASTTGGGKKSHALQLQARRNRAAAARRAAASSSTTSHAAHPEDPTDSTVKHAEPKTAKLAAGAGVGGYPQGEYDVANPKHGAFRGFSGKAPLDGKPDTRTDNERLLDAHFGAEDTKRFAFPTYRLDDTTASLAAEVLPVGAIVEHERVNGWRIKSAASGGIRFGHGATFREAIENYVLGEVTKGEEEAAVARFQKLTPAQQKEIHDRDESAAARTGQRHEESATAIARRAAGFEPPAPEPVSVPTKTAGAARKRMPSRKRSAAKKKK